MQTERASQENSTFAGAEGWALAVTSAQLLWISGKDALSFLQGMCTQQLNTLQEGRGVWALFLNHKGGLLTTARIWKSPASSSACGFVPDAFLIIMPPGRQAVLLQHLQKHIVSEEVELRPELSSLCVLELAGPMAPKGLCSLEALAKQHEEFLMYLPGSLEGVALLTGKRLERLAPEVFPSLDEAHWEGLRMEYGRAAWGKELEAGCLATEFRLDWAIHPAKGCYVGQEAVTRTTFRTVPRKRLGAFVAEDGQEGRLLARGTALWNQSQEVGKVLSSSLSPTFGSVLAMARVLRAHAEPGQVLSTSEGLKLRAVELPLWKAAPSSA